jgi:hypothetical protein
VIGAATSRWAAPLLAVLLLPVGASGGGSFVGPAPWVSFDPNAFVPDRGGGDAFEPRDSRSRSERLAAGTPDAEGRPPLLPPIDHFIRRDAER